MNFKIPDSVLYLALGINFSLFMLGIALSKLDMSLLAVISGMLCMYPILFQKKE